MLYEIKVRIPRENRKGEEKVVTEHYILEAETFGEAEERGFKECEYSNKRADSDVVAVFRSAIKEIVNNKEEDKPFFCAKVTDIFTADDGTEKETSYQMLVCATDLMEANTIMAEYLQQGYNMRLDAIRKTKILDYLH